MSLTKDTLIQPTALQSLAVGLVLDNNLGASFPLWSSSEILTPLTMLHVSTVWWFIADTSKSRDLDKVSMGCESSYISVAVLTKVSTVTVVHLVVSAVDGWQFLMIRGVQFKLVPLSFTNWNSSRFQEWLHNILSCRRRNMHIPSSLSLKTFFSFF